MPANNTRLRRIDAFLDEERAQSMADEGGFYAAEIEGEELSIGTPPQAIRQTPQSPPPPRAAFPWLWVGAAAAVGLTTFAIFRVYLSLRQRAEPALQPE